jgi:hypothetical protein
MTSVIAIPDKETSYLISFFKRSMKTCICGGPLEYTFEKDFDLMLENIVRKCVRCGKKEAFENVRRFIDDYQNPNRKIEWKLMEGARVFKQPEQKVNQGEYQRKVKRNE